jgi:hypothetical protein
MRRVLLGGIAAFAFVAAPASAANVTVDCADLPGALTGASAGEVITLDELCKSGFPYELPSVPVTLDGTPGAGFDGGGPSTSAQIIGGTASATIEGLLFENAETTGVSSGGALSINGPGKGLEFKLLHDTFNNDAATGTSGEGGGARINTATGTVIVEGSTFSGDSAEQAGGGLAIIAAAVTVTGDTFSGDHAVSNAQGGGLFAVFGAGGATLSSSQFSNDTATDAGGGAMIRSGVAPGTLTASGDSFAHDSVADPGGVSTDFTGYFGGGLSFLGQVPTNVVQSEDTFDSNSVSFKVAPISAMGGGEALIGAELKSTGDRFTNNSLQSPSEAKNSKMEPTFGWGAGLSVATCGDIGSVPPGAANLVQTLTDAVVAGNTLASGPSANGAGIYVGVVCSSGATTLHVNDSTVAGNTISGSSGPVAGISGGPKDVLSLANTIVFGDGGGAELGGFNGLASVTAASSDVCSGTSPFAGAGNICADPKLVGPGSGSADVHETAASPTREAGSNALVPSGLTVDAFGAPRIVGPTGCAVNPAAIVDIGAAEYQTPPCPPVALTLLLPTAPVLGGLSESARTWREGGLLARLSSSKGKRKKKPPVGTTFSFSLNEAATVTFKFTKPARGRRVGKKCVAPTRRNRHRHLCTRNLLAGTLSFSAHAGRNAVRFEGRISKHRKLKPGSSYSVLVTATASGKHSATRTLRFRIAG